MRVPRWARNNRISRFSTVGASNEHCSARDEKKYKLFLIIHFEYKEASLFSEVLGTKTSGINSFRGVICESPPFEHANSQCDREMGRSGRSGCHSKFSISPCQLQPLDVRSRRTSSSLQRSWIWQVQARLTKVVWLFPWHQTCSTVPVVVLEGCERQPSETNSRQCSYPRNRPASDWHLRYV